MPDTRSRSRVYLLLILALGVIPLLGSWYLLSETRDSGPWATTNHGHLLIGSDLKSVGLAELTSSQGKWRLIIVPEHLGCSIDCQKALPILRALHLRLGKDSTRVERVVLGPQQLEAQASDNLPVQHLAVVSQLDSGVYIADPLGNLVLKYDWSQVGAPLLEDLEHLLDLSRIG